MPENPQQWLNIFFSCVTRTTGINFRVFLSCMKFVQLKIERQGQGKANGGYINTPRYE